jgi:hypothetical protein
MYPSAQQAQTGEQRFMSLQQTMVWSQVRQPLLVSMHAQDIQYEVAQSRLLGRSYSQQMTLILWG